jgi:hypothetical protein
MAYVVESKIARTDGTTAASITFDDWFTDQRNGDYIIVCACNDGGGTALTASMGWAIIGTALNNSGQRTGLWWAKVTSPLGAPVIGGATDDWATCALLVRDAPDVSDASWIDTFAQNDQTVSSNTPTAPAVTTTTDDCLILRFIGRDGSGIVVPPEGWGQEFFEAGTADTKLSTATNAQVRATSSLAKTAGVVPQKVYYHAPADGGTAFTVAVRNKVGGGVPHGVSGSPTVVTDYVTSAPTMASIHNEVATIAGVSTIASTVTAAVLTSQATASDMFGPYRAAQFNSNSALGMCGVWHSIAETDFSTGLYHLTFRQVSATQHSVLGPLFFFRDALGAWVVLRFANRTRLGGYRTIVRDLPAETPVDSSGTIDWSRITAVGYVCHCTGALTTVRSFEVRWLCILPKTAPLRVFGGSAGNPVTSRSLAKALTGDTAWDTSIGLGVGMNLVKIPVGFGDGATTTYLDDEAQSLEYPKDGSAPEYAVGAQNQRLTIRTSSSDTIVFSAGVKASSDIQQLYIDPASSLSATYGTAGAFIGLRVMSLDGFEWVGSTFAKCEKVDGVAGTFTGCTFKSSAASTACLSLDAGATVEGSTFTKGFETYAIELTEPGTYTLLDNTFSGYATVLNILAASGTVTVVLGLGNPTPTYATAGATVVFDQPTVLPTLTVSGFETGSDVVIYSNAASTGDGSNVIQTFDEVVGTSVGYTYTYAPGQIISIGVFKPGKVPLRVNNVPLGTASATIPVSQRADLNYTV